MQTDKVVKSVENAIISVSRNIKRNGGSAGIDRLNAFARVLNSYRKLVEINGDAAGEEGKQAGESYYSKMERECLAELEAKRGANKK